MAAEILVAKDTAALMFEGNRVVVHKGVTRVRAGHPMLKGHEDLFEPVTVHYDVEDTKADPGTKRGGGKAKG